MATTPQLNYPDGSGTASSLTITTNVIEMSFSGIVDANTVDIQVDMNGSGFVSNPTLVDISAGKFKIPNPSSLPNGVQLEYGDNTIRLRSVDLSGGVSPPAVISVTVFTDDDLGSPAQSPTGVVAQRRSKSVDICWSDVMTNEASGYNIYASTGAGGTGSGYLRVNEEMIPIDSTKVSDYYESTIGNFVHDLSDTDGSSYLQIITDTTNPSTGDTIERKSVNMIPLLGETNYRLSVDVVSRMPVKRFVFNHDRSRSIGSGILNSDVFGTVASEDPLFYVVTALYYDKSSGDYFESSYSQELTGAPLPLDKVVRGISIRNQSEIARDYIEEVQKTEPVLSLIPGSTIREVHIEPFSNEAQRIYFLLDFVHRAKSFTALLTIDDPNQTGISIPVDNSQYKIGLRSALNVADNSSVQNLIDSAFDSLAQNFGTPRLGKRSAVVMQTFYTTTTPTRDLLVSQNAVVSSSFDSSIPRFIARGAVFMYASRAQQYWNVEKNRYEVKVEMIAETSGSVGNISANMLDTIVSGASGLKTINEEAADFGRDAQSNLELSEMAMRSLLSLDTGTEGGYYKKAVAIPGVLEVKVVKSGDTFMMRDWDPLRKKHIGGKVDIYVKGVIERTIVESFAFQFTVAKNMRFEVVNATNLIFRALDSRLSPSNPIREILNNPAQELGMRNHSTFPTKSYDLTGAVILDYNTIQINSSIPQPSTQFDDFVEGDYRYRSNNRFVASVQPIRRVSSVVGQMSGSLDPSVGYDLYKTQDPLLDGESSLAQDYVSINQVNGIPSGQMFQVNDEQHVLIGQFEEPLGSVGINSFSLSIYSRDRMVEYQGPDSPNPDYLIIEGTQTSSARIVRTALSNINSGDVVSVDYLHDENFDVTYVVNDVVRRVASVVSTMRHATADVAVKQSLENPMSIESTIQLLPGTTQSTVDSNVRTSLTRLTNLRGLGKSIHQSDATGAIENVHGVDYLVQPYSKFTLQTGAHRIREKVYSDFEFMPQLSYGSNAVYILSQPLPFNTSDGGGPDTLHVGVYMDDQEMEKSSSVYDVGSGLHKWWIVGRLGASIAGYSDDDTLSIEFDTAEKIESERIRKTANKVLVSLDAGSYPFDSPDKHSFSATYIVSGDSSVRDVTVSPIEYLTIGDVVLTYKSA